jgi:hypothetical protein
MPFDATAFDAATQPELPNRRNAWKVRPDQTATKPLYRPLDDRTVLSGLRGTLLANPDKWLKHRLCNPTTGARCVLGWVITYTEPMRQVPEWSQQSWSQQSLRILAAIHAALPPSAQRGSHQDAIVRYNDSHGLPALIRVIDRAIAALDGP